jgi:hypothetical protein
MPEKPPLGATDYACECGKKWVFPKAAVADKEAVRLPCECGRTLVIGNGVVYLRPAGRPIGQALKRDEPVFESPPKHLDGALGARLLQKPREVCHGGFEADVQSSCYFFGSAPFTDQLKAFRFAGRWPRSWIAGNRLVQPAGSAEPDPLSP